MSDYDKFSKDERQEPLQKPINGDVQDDKRTEQNKTTDLGVEISSQRSEESGKEIVPEETGMIKPDDFSPVPPPRAEDSRYSVVPPPVAEENVADSTATTSETAGEESEEEPQETVVLDSPVESPPATEDAAKDSPEDKGYYPGYQRAPWATDSAKRPTEEPVAEDKPAEPSRLRPPWVIQEEPELPGAAPSSEWEEWERWKAQRSAEELEEFKAWRRWSEQQAKADAAQEVPWDMPVEEPAPQVRQPSSFDPASQRTERPIQQQPPQPSQWQIPSPQDPYQWNYANYEQYYKKPVKKKNRGIAVFFILLAAILVLGVVGVGIANVFSERQQPSGGLHNNELPLRETPEGDPGVDLDMNITETPDRSMEKLPPAGDILTVPQVAKKVIPSVVGVMKYSDNPYEPTGLGSGIIISVSESGDVYIVSNAHVVEQGNKFMVRTSDGSEFNATLVGEDVRSDLAVVKILANELGDYTPVPAELGTSERTQVGEVAVAIGNPVNFDLSGSVTQGIVSAIDRKIRTDTSNMRYIQTDAAINPGNSGGALANAYGQVIGINTMKVNAIGFEGIGFAIPISDAVPVIEELVAHGTVTSRAMLGISAYSVLETRDGNTTIPAGVMVKAVSKNARFTPEILQYDIITHCEGERVYTSVDLHTITDEKKAGDTLELTVFRKSSTVSYETLPITVELISSADFTDQNLGDDTPEYPGIDPEEEQR